MKRTCVLVFLLAAACSCRAAPPPPRAPDPDPAPVAKDAPAPARRFPSPRALLPWSLGFLLSGAVGAAIGQGRGRAGAGLFFGLIAGPIGWAVVAAGPDLRTRCRFCQAPVAKGAVRCPRCSASLAEI